MIVALSDGIGIALRNYLVAGSEMVFEKELPISFINSNSDLLIDAIAKYLNVKCGQNAEFVTLGS